MRIEVLNGVLYKGEILIFGGDNTIELLYGGGRSIIKLREKELRLNFRHACSMACYGHRIYFVNPFL